MSELMDALQIVQEWLVVTGEEKTYREACEYLVAHRDELPFRVFINFPGGHGSDSDPAWETVWLGSVERCDCGNERMIVPAHPRTEYLPADSEPVQISPGTPLYLRPKGSAKSLAYVKLWVEDVYLKVLENPFAPLVINIATLFSDKGFSLSQLAEALQKQTKPAVYMFSLGNGIRIPLCGISAVDMAVPTVTLIPDQDVEIFGP